MRFLRVPILILVAAASASAQETQQDLAERIVREQEEIRARSVAKAVGAPGQAFDRYDAAAHSVGETPAARAATPAAPPAPRRFSWGWAVGAGAAVVALGVFAAAWRRAGDERR